MAVRVGDTLKQMNDLPFPIAEAKDISLGDSNVEDEFSALLSKVEEIEKSQKVEIRVNNDGSAILQSAGVNFLVDLNGNAMI